MIKKMLCAAALLGVMMSAQAKTFLIDVRTPAEVAQTGRVEGAIVADLYAPDFIKQFEATSAKPEDQIELYCRSGHRAGIAAGKIEALGYKNVRNLGGYEAAAAALHRPLVK